jgi:hypothetical protein
MRRALHKSATLLLIAALLVPAPLSARQRPSRRPPIWVDADQQHIPEPKSRRVSLYYDFFDSSFIQPAKRTFNLARLAGPRPASNVNSVDGVPDSSWFTTRNARRTMLPEEIRRGPSVSGGPWLEGPWTITSSKALGASPGFVIADAKGQRFLIKFDHPDYPELATGAEVAATRLYYAAGYNTPETYITRFRPEMLRLKDGVTIIDAQGKKRPMTQADVDGILAGVARQPDGSIRVMASRFLSGKVKGQFLFYGRRKDDPNDWISHEHRRELRGLRVIASWLNDDDVYAMNTLDVYVTEGGRSFLRHYILDFSSSFGADNRHPNYDRAGYEYQIDGGEILKSLFSFGFYRRPWENRAPVVHPSVGNFDNALFHPARWKPNEPLPAFDNLTTADGYWAAKIVMSFTDEQIRAAIAAGEYSDPAAAEYLVRTLAERRDIIGRYWYERAGALDDFRVRRGAEGTWLECSDLLVAHRFRTPSERAYRYRVKTEGAAGAWQALAGSAPRILLDPVANHGEFVVELQARDIASREWSPGVEVHLAPEKGSFVLLGWVRSDE